MSDAQSLYREKDLLEQKLVYAWSPAVECYARLCSRLGHFWQPMEFLRNHAPKRPDAKTVAAYAHLLLGTGSIKQTRGWMRKINADAPEPYLIEQQLRLNVRAGQSGSFSGRTETHQCQAILRDTLSLIAAKDSAPSPEVVNRDWENTKEISECAHDLAYYYAQAGEHRRGIELLRKWLARAPDDPGIAAGYAALLAALHEVEECRAVCEQMKTSGFTGVFFDVLPLVAGEPLENNLLFKKIRKILHDEPICGDAGRVWLSHCRPWSRRSFELANAMAPRFADLLNFGYGWQRTL